MGLVFLCLGEQLREGEASARLNWGGWARGMPRGFPRFCPVPEPLAFPIPQGCL